MENTKWYVSRVQRQNAGGELYNAVRCVNGVWEESIQTPTYSYVAACRRAEQLNMQDQLRKVRVK